VGGSGTGGGEHADGSSPCNSKTPFHITSLDTLQWHALGLQIIRPERLQIIIFELVTDKTRKTRTAVL
jgi:hypothetical protein